MSVSAACSWIVVLPIVAVLLLLFIRAALRPRRRGTTPHCGKCDYNLTALTSDRCPECGETVTPESIVYGEPSRRPFVAVAAGVGIVLLLIVGVQFVRKANWYHYRPAGWVLQDLQSSNPTTYWKAWRELDRRSDAGRLGARHRARLIDLCLQEQGSTAPARPLRGDMIQYLGRCYLDGAMSEAQEKKFFDQVVQLQLQVRPKVIAGDPVPYRVNERGRCPSSPFWVKLKGAYVQMDGKRSGQGIGPGGTFSGSGGGGSSGSVLNCDQPGRHTLQVAVNFEFYHGKHGKPDWSRLLHSGQKVLQGTFEILETEPPDYMKLVDDPSMVGTLLYAIQPDSFTLRKLPNEYLNMRFQVVNLPINVAFDIIARIADQEVPLGTLTLLKGTSGRHGTGSSTIPPKDTFDLILRSNGEKARRTVDMFEIWQGELVYQGVQIEPE